MQSLELKRWQAIIAFLIVVILVGSLPPVTKQAVFYLKPNVQLAVRYIIALFFFIPWIVNITLNFKPIRSWKSRIGFFSNRHIKGCDVHDFLEDTTPETFSNNQLLRDGIFLGILTFFVHAFLSFGVKTISANRASFFFGLCVVFVTLLDLIYRKRFSLQIFFAAALAFTGSGLMSWEQSSEPLIGSLFVLGAVACEAIFLVLLEDIAPRHHPLTLSVVRLGVATALALVFAAAELPNQLTVIQSNFAPLLYLGFATAAISWLIIFALQTLPAFEASLIQGLEPVFGAVISFVLLGEVFGLRGLIGSGLILTGTLLVILTPATEMRRGKELANYSNRQGG